MDWKQIRVLRPNFCQTDYRSKTFSYRGACPQGQAPYELHPLEGGNGRFLENAQEDRCTSRRMGVGATQGRGSCFINGITPSKIRGTFLLRSSALRLVGLLSRCPAIPLPQEAAGRKYFYDRPGFSTCYRGIGTQPLWMQGDGEDEPTGGCGGGVAVTLALLWHQRGCPTSYHGM